MFLGPSFIIIKWTWQFFPQNLTPHPSPRIKHKRIPSDLGYSFVHPVIQQLLWHFFEDTFYGKLGTSNENCEGKMWHCFRCIIWQRNLNEYSKSAPPKFNNIPSYKSKKENIISPLNELYFSNALEVFLLKL